METINEIERTRRRLLEEGRPILDLTNANPTQCGFHFPPEILRNAYEGYLSRPFYHPHPKGLLQAREAISDYYTGFHPPADQILLTSGTSESFFYLFKLLCAPGEAVLTPVPTYPLFDAIAQLAGIRLETYALDPENAWQPDIGLIAEALITGAKAIILISPHNPTGSVITGEKLEQIVSLANRHRIPVICDEVFSEFLCSGEKYPRVAHITRPDLCFTLNGISKLLALPAFKLGWVTVTGKPSLVRDALDRLEHIADTFLSCHSAIQAALPALLKEGKSFLNSYQQGVQERGRLAVNALASCPGLRFIPPAGGFYLSFQCLRSPLNDEEFALHLLEQKGVLIHPGYFFDFAQDHYGVISFLTEPDLLEKGLGLMIQEVNEIS